MTKKNTFKIQTLIFQKKYYPNKRNIRNWINKHIEFKLMKGKRFPIEKTQNSFRVRQRHPWFFKKSTFKTINITKSGSIKAVIGKLK
jgi:hypothetical protein